MEVDAGNGEVALRAVINGKYVMANNAGNGALIASAGGIGTWERFRWIDLGDGQVARQAVTNNQYVSAENAGNSSLIAIEIGRSCGKHLPMKSSHSEDHD